MARFSHLLSSFTAGLLSPNMFGRIDLQKVYSSALRVCKNFVVRPQGGLISRTGSTYLGDTGLDGKKALLVEFHPNEDLSFSLEFGQDSGGNDYIKAIPSDHVIDPSGNPIVVITTTSPYALAELSDLRWDYQNDSVYLTHPKVKPKELRFNGMSASPIFSLDDIDFTSHPYQKPDSSDTTLRFVEDTHYVKIISSNATEFDGLTNETHIEYKFGGQWQLGRIAGDTYLTLGDDFQDGSAVPDPSGDTCYIVPANKLVKDFNLATKSVIVNEQYIADTTPNPDGDSVTTIVDRKYPDLPTAVSNDHWWLRADTQVFTDDMVGAWVRIRSNYNGVRNPDDFSDGDIRWGKILKRIGQEAHPTEFLEPPERQDLIEGHTYLVIREGTGYQMTVAAPMEGTSNLAWDLAFLYDQEGESFQPLSEWWYDHSNTTKGKYTTASAHPSAPSATSDYFSATTVLAHMDSQKSFDVAVLDELVGPPVGADLTANKLLSLSGEITTIDDEDNLSRLGRIRAPSPFWYHVSNNPTGFRGDYLMMLHKDRYVTYKVLSITDEYEAKVQVVDGDPPIDNDTGEFYDEGRTSKFRLSAWWTDNWPYAVAFHESRIVFGGSPNFPEHVWGSKLDDDLDFRTIENDGKVLDTTGFTYPLRGKSFDRILWLDSGQVLNIGTQNSEWQLRPNQFASPLTAVNLRITEQTQNGATLPPIKVDGILLFPDGTGKRLLEYFFDFQQDKHVSRNLSVFTDTLLFEDPIIDVAYQANPIGVIWMVTKSGKLYSVTYNRQQEVIAWAEHETEGRYVNVSVMRATSSTQGHDRVLFLVERDITSGTKTYREVSDPLFTNYVDPVKKIGITTLDSVARIWSEEIGNNPPNPEGGTTPGTPTMIESSPVWSDPWNWNYAGSSNTTSIDKLKTAKLWWAETSNALDDDDVLYGDEFWGATNSAQVDFGKATAGQWVAFDLQRTFLINAFGLRKGILGVNDEVWIHSLELHVAQDTLGGGAFDNNALTWQKVDDWDWSTKFAGVALSELAYGVETLSSPVSARYVRFTVTESWTDHGRGLETDLDLDRVDFELAPLNSATNTVRFTKTRAETTKKLFSMSSKSWSVNGDLTGAPDYEADKAWYNTGANLWSYHTNGTDTNMNTLTSQLAPGERAIVDYTGPAVTISRIVQSGSWVSVNNHPTDIEVWLRKEGETGWTLYRNFDWRTTEYELPRWQLSNGIGTLERVSFEIPQARYIGVRLIGINNGGGNIGWDISETYLMNEYETSEGDPDP